MFSVVIPAYNRANTLPRAIESVLNQTLMDFELIVVDDGSTDNTAEVVKSYSDHRLQYVFTENRGRCAARNLGARKASRKFLTFLDSDDEALPEWLFAMLQAFESSDVGIVSCGFVSNKEGNGEHQQRTVLPKRKNPLFFNEVALFRPPGTFAIAKDIFLATGGYEESISYSENTELAMRLISYCKENGKKVVAIPKGLVIYHHRLGQRIPKTHGEFGAILAGAECILRQHGNRMKQVFPRGYANYCSIAAINAARLGMQQKAFQSMKEALSHHFTVRNLMRLILILIPPLGRLVWLHHERNKIIGFLAHRSSPLRDNDAV